jgi:hypothetical protein
MSTEQVTTKDTIIKRKQKKPASWYRRWWFFSVVGLAVVLAAGTTFKMVTAAPQPTEAPEAAKVLKAQELMGNFGILIPAYLPKGFDRSGMEINVNQTGPADEPAVDMVYRGKNDATLFMHQWVPANPAMETLSGSRIIETKWGKSWLLTEGTDGLVAVWVDIGPLRVSLSSPSQATASREQLVMAAETLSLASNSQAFSFVAQLPQIKDIVPPPPFEVRPNAEGVQELNLTITPGGYTPLRFAVQKNIPVKINFRALGEVGCGNVLLLPHDTGSYESLTVSKTAPLQTTTFTPQTAGDFQFICASNHYRGIMTVREAVK